MGGVGRSGSCGGGCSGSAQGSGIYELILLLFILAENGFKWVVWLTVEAKVSGVVA